LKKTAVVALSALSASMFGQALGTWSEINWPNGYYVRAIHLVLLPDERMLLWNNSYSFGQPLTTTPNLTVVSPGTAHAYNIFSVGGAANNTTNLFCVGFTMLEDGRLFAAGGHKIENGYGDDRINVFDWRNPNNEWITGTNVMTQLRWYPTATYLPDRRVLITTGIGGPTHAPSYIPDLWVMDVPWLGTPLKDYHAALPNFPTVDSYYPFWFVDPKDGNMFLANRGKADESPNPNKKLNLATLQLSTYGALSNQNINVREQYPSAVMINAKNDKGVREAILVMTGGAKSGDETLSSNSALFANLYADPPTWTPAQPMNFTRQCHTLVALPTRDVIAFGGTDRFGPNGKPYLQEALPRSAPELWNPFATDRATRPWKLLTLPTRQIPRGYHSTALLMPDARIMTAGGEPEGAAAGTGYEWQEVPQIFSPPYGGRADWITRRPTLSGVPASIGYGDTFDVTITPNATSNEPIERLVMISPGAVTHAFNERQEVYELDFVHLAGNTYRVTAPAATRLATPGYYMVFAVDATDDGTAGETRIKGIPSVCQWLQVKDYTQVFVSGGRIARGSSSTAINWSAPNELLLGENAYLGSAIFYGPWLNGPRAEIEFEGTSPTTSVTKVRFSAQVKVLGDGEMKVFFKNQTTSAWVLVDTRSVNATEKNYDIVANNANFVGASGKIAAKLEFKQTAPALSTPRVYIDVAELGIR